ncbi:MAG: LemA family protein [Pseudomonadota bacterium]
MIGLVVCGLLLIDVVKFQSVISRLFAVENETEHNAEIARAKRDAVLGQLLQVAREFAALEERVLSQAETYPQAIAILGSLPSKFPNISASSHYLALMAEISREQTAVQMKAETHNAAVREYNAALNSFRGSLYTLGQNADRTYLGDDWINRLSSTAKTLLT